MARLRITAHRRKQAWHVRGKGTARARKSKWDYEAEDRGKKGKGKKVVVAKRKGALTKFGYHLKDKDETRHEALDRIIRDTKKGGVSTKEEQRVLGQVGAPMIWFKRTNPEYAERARKDKSYIAEKLP